MRTLSQSPQPTTTTRFTDKQWRALHDLFDLLHNFGINTRPLPFLFFDLKSVTYDAKDLKLWPSLQTEDDT